MAAFALPAELTLQTAPALRQQALLALQSQPAPWVVDAAGLHDFDSSSLALLLELRRAAPQQQLQVRGAPQRLRDLIAAYGLDFLLDSVAASPQP
ncbi:STAS domain-containing protein [Thiomonas sp.]|uniref:STAS domain-containing protein n=1 Tax=Thiomonas sp. TaxID=2047785 RepID=UPI0026037790|nr:STAS domain-containing protein [Thiomonas sp.]